MPKKFFVTAVLGLFSTIIFKMSNVSSLF